VVVAVVVVFGSEQHQFQSFIKHPIADYVKPQLLYCST
jgi:hypothetical protein